LSAHENNRLRRQGEANVAARKTLVIAGLTRQSINLHEGILSKKMGHRVKPGDDE
jgi:hypothetical protein